MISMATVGVDDMALVLPRLAIPLTLLSVLNAYSRLALCHWTSEAYYDLFCIANALCQVAVPFVSEHFSTYLEGPCSCISKLFRVRFGR